MFTEDYNKLYGLFYVFEDITVKCACIGVGKKRIDALSRALDSVELDIDKLNKIRNELGKEFQTEQQKERRCIKHNREMKLNPFGSPECGNVYFCPSCSALKLKRNVDEIITIIKDNTNNFSKKKRCWE